MELVQHTLKQTMPASIAVRTMAEWLALETAFQDSRTPVGPIFMLGTAIGFIVGMMISYQILYTDLSEQLSQYATLKAMGYENAYLVKVVLEQASFYALVAFLPSWLLGVCLLLHHRRDHAAAAPHDFRHFCPDSCSYHWNVQLSGFLAVRRVLAADPAELFR